MIDTLKRIFVPYLYLSLLTFIFAIIFIAQLNIFSSTEVYSWPEMMEGKKTFFSVFFSLYVLLLFPYFWVVMKEERASIAIAMAMSGLMGSFLLNNFLATLMIWILALVAIIDWIRHRRFHLHWIYLLLPLLFLVRLVYMLVGGHSFSRIEQGLSFVIFPLIFSIVRVGPKMYASLLKVGFHYYLGVALVVLLSFAVYAQQHGFVFPDCFQVLKQHRFGYFGLPLVDHPTIFSMNMGIGVALAFLVFFSAKRQGLAMLKIVPFALVVCTVLFLSSSRAGALVSILLFLAALIFSIPMRFWIKACVCVTLSSLCVVQVLYLEEGLSERMKDIYRERMMEDSQQLIKENWVFGKGVGQMNFEVFRDDAKTESIGVFDTPHNQYITELVRFGVLGSMPFFVILLAVFLRSVVGKPRYGLLFWQLIYLPMMWIETPFEAAMTVIPLVFWLCFFFSQEEWRRTQSLGRRRLA